MPFRIKTCRPAVADAGDLLPVEFGSNCSCRPGRQVGQFLDALHMAHDVAETAGVACAACPATSAALSHVDHVWDRQLGRGGQAVLQVLVTLAGSAGPASGPAPSISPPARVRSRHRRNPHPARRKAGTRRGRGWRRPHPRSNRSTWWTAYRARRIWRRAGGMDLAIRVLHARAADRGQRHRHRDREPRHRGGLRAVGHVDRHPLAKADLAVIADILAEGLFAVAARFAIVQNIRGARFWCSRFKSSMQVITGGMVVWSPLAFAEWPYNFARDHQSPDRLADADAGSPDRKPA